MRIRQREERLKKEKENKKKKKRQRQETSHKQKAHVHRHPHHGQQYHHPSSSLPHHQPHGSQPPKVLPPQTEPGYHRKSNPKKRFDGDVLSPVRCSSPSSLIVENLQVKRSLTHLG